MSNLRKVIQTIQQMSTAYEVQSRLDDLVHQHFDSQASAVCNLGVENQVLLLLNEGGWREQDLLEDLNEVFL